MNKLFNLMFQSFMGESPKWYKQSVIAALILNPFILICFGPLITGWIILAEFIFTLALALKCYPLLPGGLIALEMVFMRLTSTGKILQEGYINFEVILLLMFMVAGIYFMKPLLAWVFTKIIFSSKNKVVLSVEFLFVGAFLSAWLDALTVMAAMMAVAVTFHEIQHALIQRETAGNNKVGDTARSITPGDIKEFSGFLRNLLMHGAIGTMVGGVATLVGEPQNMLIANVMGWNFQEFYLRMAPVSIPVQLTALIVCVLLEGFKFRFLGFGYTLPSHVRVLLEERAAKEERALSDSHRLHLVYMGIAAVWLIIGLALHLATVGLIGLSVIVLLTALTGKTNDHEIGRAFEEALPFTALLMVFFSVVAMINDQGLFKPIIDAALAHKGKSQLHHFFFASGLLSAISDNVFVATIYIQEAQKAFVNGLVDRVQFDHLAIAINAGTNILSIATPNGQAAFLFLLTSKVAKSINLSYVEMLRLALPYTIVLSAVAFLLIK